MKYVLKRVGISIIVLLGVTFTVFILMKLQPGDPYKAMLTPDMSAESIEIKLQELGYYDNVFVQYQRWFISFIKGDLGYSIYYRAPVVTKIIERFSNTLVLLSTVFVLSTIMSISIGMIASMKPNSIFDKIANFISYLGISIPTFFLAMILIKKFSFDFGLLPASGNSSVGVDLTALGQIIDKIKHMVLPVTVLVFNQSGKMISHIRESFSETLKGEYIRTARMKGLSKSSVMLKHAFPVALPNIITILSLQLPNLLSGVIVTETVFVWLGMGRLTYDAIRHNDYPLIMGVTLFNAVLVLIVSLFSDILCKFVDPRIRKVLD